jgi:mRNA interferase MazF
VNVVPLSTSARQGRRGLTTVLVPGGSGGLVEDSIALCHQVTTLDRGKLSTLVGILGADELARVDQALKLALSLD